MNAYLIPAIQELKGQEAGPVAGQVFHQFASFCDEQMRNPDAIEDYHRAEKIKTRRKIDMEALAADVRATKSQTLARSKKSDLQKYQRWLKLETLEFERLRKQREAFMTQSLENYLLSLSASDEYDNDALRFFAIWLEYADSALANAAVKKHLSKVPSAKLARLMNQLSSRLQAEQTDFQRLLGDLVYRITREHPHHGMHHITAGTHHPETDDLASISRHNAAKSIAFRLKSDKDRRTVQLWSCISWANEKYHDLARYTNEELGKAGKEVRLDSIKVSKTIMEKVPTLKLPPPTYPIAVRADMNYDDVPVITSFRPRMRVAGGLSAPKIITTTCSNGQSFKQLVSVFVCAMPLTANVNNSLKAAQMISARIRSWSRSSKKSASFSLNTLQPDSANF